MSIDEERLGKGRASAFLTVAAVLVVAAVVITAVFVGSGIDRVSFINWYRVDQPTELTVSITAGPSGWWRVTDVRETADSVTITVRSLEFSLGPQSGVGYPRELAVRLAQPLGDRAVLDGLDNRVLPQTVD